MPFAPPSPPGMLSPAAFPFPAPAFPQNDAPSLGPAPVLRGVTSYSTGSGSVTGTASLSLPPGIAPGDLILIWIAAGSAGGVQWWQGATCPGYVSCPSRTAAASGGSNNDAAYQLLWKNADGTDAARSAAGGQVTLTLSLVSGVTLAVLCAAYGNPAGGLVTFDGPVPLLVPRVNASPAAGAVATSGANERVVWLGSTTSQAAAIWVAPPPGFTQQGSVTLPPVGGLYNSASVIADLWQVPRGNIPSVTGSSNGVFTAAAALPLACAQPALFVPPPPPPGFLSPAALPFTPAAPQVINDVPVPGAPYFAARGQSADAVQVITIPVQNPTGATDTIVVAATTGNSGGNAPVSVTDTQGNAYVKLGFSAVTQSTAVYRGPQCRAPDRSRLHHRHPSQV